MPKSLLPKYLTLKRELMKQIGASKPGDMIESEHQLVRRYSVSRATVSKALGELVAEGYLYREQGRGTFVARPAAVPDGPLGVMFCGATSVLLPGNYFGDIFSGIETSARNAGRDLLFMAGKRAPGEDFRPPSPTLIAQRGLAGMILVGVDSDDHLAAVLTAGVPVVSVDYHTDRVEIDSVVGDAEAGGYLGTKALLEEGHKRIIFAGHSRHGSRAYRAPDQGSLERLAGYRRAHSEAGLQVDEALIFQPRQSDMHISGLLERLASNGTAPTAIVSTGSNIFDEAMNWARRNGKPLAWVVAGGTDPAVVAGTAGRSIVEDPAEMGRQAVKLVLDRIGGKSSASRLIRVPARLEKVVVAPAPEPTK